MICRLHSTRERPVSLTTPRESSPGILVADDEPCIRNLLGVVLGRYGFRVWLAPHGEQAVELYCRHRSEIALVLLDVRMPVLDGPATFAALRRINPTVRCCFMSADK